MGRFGVRSAALGAAVVVLALPFLADAFVGHYVRLNADDYCYATQVAARGFLDAQRYWYTQWTGAFSFSFLASAFVPWWPGFVSVFPALVLAVWVGACVLALAQPLGWARALLLGLVLVYATLAVQPTPAQVTQWHSGIAKNVSPLVVGALGIAYARWELARGGGFAPIGAAAIAFVAAGFSETYGALQTLGLGAAVLGLRGRAREMALAPLAASLGANAFMALAPGNALREAELPPQPVLVEVPAIALAAAASDLGAFVAAAPAALLLALLLTSARAMGRVRLPAWAWLVAPLGYLVCFLPSAYALSMRPPDRALVVPHFWLVCWIALAGALLGERMARVPAAAALPVFAVLLALGPIRATAQELALIGPMRTYAIAWQNADRMLRAAHDRGERRAVAPQVRHPAGLRDLTRDPDFWLNRCVADYYGLDEVVLRG